ncbi:hypothetical protein GCM10010503_56520 [Streptomyces lucensis JCM 4490]|uniref:DUF4878 domain-containing protein n=1 Tax=Streptomyces lucensis JCM 4490 TaxID=1306176 RepID=A0A918JBT7_9ACTN|nr:DUF4878 domain-containing protein [Streptomyces lucensis]GGW71891.1 hypothetical protein GCM10010503_56520 [Streptomyces lucensis JCM 4490]
MPSSRTLRRARAGLPVVYTAGLLALLATGCGSDEPGPSDVARHYVHGLAKLDRDELLDSTCASMHADIEDEDSWKELSEDVPDFLEFDVSNEKIKDDKATVTVKIDARDEDGKHSMTKDLPLTRDVDGHWKVCVGTGDAS